VPGVTGLRKFLEWLDAVSAPWAPYWTRVRSASNTVAARDRVHCTCDTFRNHLPQGGPCGDWKEFRYLGVARSMLVLSMVIVKRPHMEVG
jgi:hypothetical protein